MSRSVVRAGKVFPGDYTSEAGFVRRIIWDGHGLVTIEYESGVRIDHDPQDWVTVSHDGPGSTPKQYFDER